MRRPPHGATTRPGPSRARQPGTGAPVGRPGPSIALEPAPIELVGSLEPIVLEPIVLDEPAASGQTVISVSASASPA